MVRLPLLNPVTQRSELWERKHLVIFTQSYSLWLPFFISVSQPGTARNPQREEELGKRAPPIKFATGTKPVLSPPLLFLLKFYGGELNLFLRGCPQ